jgi:hypothetical protein
MSGSLWLLSVVLPVESANADCCLYVFLLLCRLNNRRFLAEWIYFRAYLHKKRKYLKQLNTLLDR